MLFNSIEYLLFLPAVVLCNFLLPAKYRWVLLLACSYFFYMYWRPEYALLLLTSSSIDYFAGLKLEKSEGKNRKLWLYLSLFTNLGLLIAFKYFGFFNEALRELVSLVNLDFDYSSDRYNILLPVGISFYTFQSLSYTIDLYRRRRKAERHFGIFALYVSFFPQLIAGPIERSTKLLPQFREKQTFQWQNLIDGGRLIVWGLFKKILIADTIAIYVYQVFINMEQVGGGFLFLSFLAFGLQIYFDFAAYTDIAIGSARIMGYRLMSNFERPYVAKSVGDFWGRWHISLTSWLFDYLYRPLAKNYRINWQLNVIIVFLVMGIWHGAGWGFIIFGLLNGVFFILSTYVEHLNIVVSERWPILPKWSMKIKSLLTTLLIFLPAAFSLGLWSVESLDEIQLIFQKIFLDFSFEHHLFFQAEHIFLILATVPLLFFVELQKGFVAKKPFHTIRPKWLRWGIYYYIILFLIMFGDKTTQEFYYFQF